MSTGAAQAPFLFDLPNLFGALLPFVRCVTICHPLQKRCGVSEYNMKGGET
jgi:hypothetical protein